MTSVESYQMCPPDDLQKHLDAIDQQCAQALEAYRCLEAQRSTVLQALGVTALKSQLAVA